MIAGQMAMDQWKSYALHNDGSLATDVAANHPDKLKKMKKPARTGLLSYFSGSLTTITGTLLLLTTRRAVPPMSASLNMP